MTHYEDQKGSERYDACLNILCLFYYNLELSEINPLKISHINTEWHSILREEIPNKISPEQFKKKYLLRMKLTPLEHLK